MLSSRFNFLQRFSSATFRSQLIFFLPKYFTCAESFPTRYKVSPRAQFHLYLILSELEAPTKDFLRLFQVLDERVHHIDYAPAKPEPFYRATGRELQPRTVGEENGVIVYNYMPISASHYVSQLQMLCFSLREFISVCRRSLGRGSVSRPIAKFLAVFAKHRVG